MHNVSGSNPDPVVSKERQYVNIVGVNFIASLHSIALKVTLELTLLYRGLLCWR